MVESNREALCFCTRSIAEMASTRSIPLDTGVLYAFSYLTYLE